MILQERDADPTLRGRRMYKVKMEGVTDSMTIKDIMQRKTRLDERKECVDVEIKRQMCMDTGGFWTRIANATTDEQISVPHEALGVNFIRQPSFGKIVAMISISSL